MPNRLPDDTRTLTRHDYLSDEVYEIERARIFHRGWMFAARGDRLQPGNRTVVELAGESVLLAISMARCMHWPTCAATAAPGCATSTTTAVKVR